jgi:GalNAc-alpha-(1->4)-GalNAc-alpha-(1->3)-diNAcBac-PP-undecaprenol alpha-1,4-N-acetyl-D-galactosaminyltransferase
MKKILIIAPSRKLGGIERALSVLANEWTNQGIDVIYVSCLKNDPFYALENQIQIIEPSFERSSGIINRFAFYPRLVFFLRNIVKKNNPDRVVVFGDWFSPIALLALLNTKFQVYISDRTIPNYKFKFPIPQLKKWLYPKSAGFIAQTKRAKEFKENVFGTRLRIQVIPNALPEFKETANESVIRENKIIYVGRFAWEKDPEILIRSMVIISEKHPNWKLEMAGSGPLLTPMKLLVNELKLESNVVFLGNVQQVANLYNSANLLVLPSVVEGFPNTLIEAMSFGLPCVCFSDIPYEDIIVDRENGYVVPERLPKLLAKTIIEAIANEELRVKMGANAKTTVKRFAKEKIAKEILEFMKL